jgi:hypothetical protein
MGEKDHRSEVVARAVKDAGFREELKKDAAKAIEKAVGVKVPPGVAIKVVEDSASVVHLVLPPADLALDEKALGKVSGGVSYATIVGPCYDQSSSYRAPCK